MRLTILGLALLAAPAAADPVFDMCMKPGTYGPEQCDCVAEGLRAELSPSDHALYSSISGRYLERLAQGKSQADAWDAAVQSEAEARQASYPGILGIADGIAARYRDIRGRCGG